MYCTFLHFVSCAFAFCILCVCVESSSSHKYTLPCSFSHCSVAYSCMLQCLPTDLLIPLVPVTNHVKFGQVGIVTVNFGLQLNSHNNTTKLGFTQSDFRTWNFAMQTCSCKCDFLCTCYLYIEMIPRCILFYPRPKKKKKRKKKTNPIGTEPPQVWCLGQLADLWSE